MQSHPTTLGPSIGLVKCRISWVGGSTKSGLVPDARGPGPTAGCQWRVWDGGSAGSGGNSEAGSSCHGQGYAAFPSNDAQDS